MARMLQYTGYYAGVAKLVDAQVLGTCGVILGGSSPLARTVTRTRYATAETIASQMPATPVPRIAFHIVTRNVVIRRACVALLLPRWSDLFDARGGSLERCVVEEIGRRVRDRVRAVRGEGLG